MALPSPTALGGARPRKMRRSVDKRFIGRGVVELRNRRVPPRAAGEGEVEVLFRGYLMPEYDAGEGT